MMENANIKLHHVYIFVFQEQLTCEQSKKVAKPIDTTEHAKTLEQIRDGSGLKLRITNLR